MEGWGGIEGFELVGDESRVHYVGAIGEFDSWGGVIDAFFVCRDAGLLVRRGWLIFCRIKLTVVQVWV